MALHISGFSKTYSNGVRALKNPSPIVGKRYVRTAGPEWCRQQRVPLRTMTTLQEPDEGSIGLDGLDGLRQKNEVRKILGYLPQDFAVYPKMSANARPLAISVGLHLEPLQL